MSGKARRAAGEIMGSILDVTRQFYRAAQDASADAFDDVALAALRGYVRFEAALWFRGGFESGRLQVHRLHGFRLPPPAVEQLISFSRQFPQPIALSAASPGVAHVFDAAITYGEPACEPALECARRWGLERQMAIAHSEDGAAAGEWLCLHRREADAPFDRRDRTLLGLLMPHLSEARTVHRSLRLARTSDEASLAQGPHRALTLLDGTVLNCGARVSACISLGWPDWDGVRVPGPLLRKLIGEGSMSLPQRGESISVRRLADALLLTVKRLPLAARLTQRELQIVQHFGAGRGCKDIARRCGLSPAAVRNIVQRSYRKLGINNKAQLARLIARAEGQS